MLCFYTNIFYLLLGFFECDNLVGCLFHFKQALSRNLDTAGEYRFPKAIKKTILRCMTAFTTMPPADFRLGCFYVLSQVNAKAVELHCTSEERRFFAEDLRKFFAYFEKVTSTA